MKWTRMILAAAVVIGGGLGCSKKEVASIPADAPRPEEGKTLDVKPGRTFQMKQRGGPVKTGN
jgi:hypothetical protein